MDLEGALDRYFEKLQAKVAKEVRNKLGYMGMDAVNTARDRHPQDWTDHTGNLRSSIGYAVFENGKKIDGSAFEVVKEGNEGSEKGRALIKSLANEMTSSYGLAIVAGMDYASFVEAKGYDVLAGAELHLRANWEQDLQDAIEGAIEAMNRERII